MNEKGDTYGKVADDTIPTIIGDNRFLEYGREMVRLVIELGREATVRVHDGQPARLAAAHLLLAAELVQRVGRPINDVFSLTPSGREAVGRVAKQGRS